jgi:hypothetical protein
MPARTLLDDTINEVAEDRRRQRERDFGDKDAKEWARKWMEAKRRGGIDREIDWYSNNNRRNYR